MGIQIFADLDTKAKLPTGAIATLETALARLGLLATSKLDVSHEERGNPGTEGVTLVGTTGRYGISLTLRHADGRRFICTLNQNGGGNNSYYNRLYKTLNDPAPVMPIRQPSQKRIATGGTSARSTSPRVLRIAALDTRVEMLRKRILTAGVELGKAIVERAILDGSDIFPGAEDRGEK